MTRIHNFSAGPATLPLEVLETAARELVDYQGNGLSVMEMSHRSSAYEAIIKQTERDIRTLANIPEDYAVLFLQGGATLQFSMVPMNLSVKGKADFLITGHWAQKAAQEAQKYTDARVIASSEDLQFTAIPTFRAQDFRNDADYVHICENNTIYGTQFHALPDTGKIPLVADQSSCIFSKPLDIARYGLIYAGAQKNIGPAGLTLVIIRKDLIRKDLPEATPLLLRYDTHLGSDSMYNTPPTYAIYITGLVVRWLLDNGGLEAARARNEKKAALLYKTLDESRLFRGTADRGSRSLMNVTFLTGDEQKDADFIKMAAKRGIQGIKGYRTVGGMRASLYNALPYEAVEALCEAMKDFEREQPC